MLNKDDSIRNSFFVIDSNNVDDIRDKLYGFGFSNAAIITNDNKKDKQLDNNGCYVDVAVNDNEIVITQDFIGSYGLYYFKSENDYFAISNSFVMLVKHLSKEYNLTYDKEYADAYVFSGLCLNAYKDTLIKEIKLLPRNTLVRINKTDVSIEFDEIDYREQSIDIDSELGIKTIDSWYEKWVKIIRNLIKNSKNVSFELSGGFDSRVVSTLWLTSNIDLKNINIISYNNEIFEEDYVIVSKIADFFNFSLNRGLSVDFTQVNNDKTPIDISFYTKSCTTNLMYFKNKYNEEVYTFNGGGGETIRIFYDQTPEEFIKSVQYSVQINDSTLANSNKNFLKRSLNYLKEEYGENENSKELVERLYKETRARFHFGKSKIEDFIANNHSISPLLDNQLQQIKLTTDYCDDRYLLMAIIITRYCPELLNFEIQGNRRFNEETLKYAKIINEKYPLKKHEYEFIETDHSNIDDLKLFNNKNMNSENKLIKIFNSEAFKRDFKELYSSKAYNKIIENSYYLGNQHIYGIISSLSLVLIKNYLKDKTSKEPSDILESYLSNYKRGDLDSLVSKYYTASLDIKGIDETDDLLEIIDVSDNNAQIISPHYFQKELYSGFNIESNEGNLDIKVKSKKDVELIIELKGINYVLKSLDEEEEYLRVPVNIDYKQLSIDNHLIFDESTVTNYEKPYIHTVDIKKDEIITIHIEWLPINFNSHYDRITSKVPTEIILNSIDESELDETIIISGKLIELKNNEVIPDAAIKLLINNGRSTIKTDEEGIFEHTIKANRVGINNITAIYGGNSIYDLSNNTTNFNIKQLKTEIILDEIESTKLGNEVNISGKLVDERNNIIPNATIKLIINNGRATVRTNEEGVFVRPFKTNKIGTNNIIAIYNGNNTYELTNNVTHFEVKQLKTELILDPIRDTQLGNTTDVSGKLVDERNNIIPNATIRLIINNGRATAKTNEEGIFKYTYKTTRTGMVPMMVMFFGNKNYTPVNTTLRFNVE